jgi:hypothetical protein
VEGTGRLIWISPDNQVVREGMLRDYGMPAPQSGARRGVVRGSRS